MGPEKVDRNYTFLYSYGNLKCKWNFFLLLEVKDIVGHYWIITKAFFGSNNEKRGKKNNQMKNEFILHGENVTTSNKATKYLLFCWYSHENIL